MSKQKSPPPHGFETESLLGDYTKKGQKARKASLSFLLKSFHPNGTIEKYRTSSLRRFLNYTRKIIEQNPQYKTYLKVSYGKRECNLGCVCTFYNDGFYENSTDLWQALCSFIEDYHRRPIK